MAIARKPATKPAKAPSGEPTKSKADAYISGSSEDMRSDFRAPVAADSARVPVMMRIPGDLLQRIDAAAKQRGLSRSGWFLMVATRALDRDDF